MKPRILLLTALSIGILAVPPAAPAGPLVDAGEHVLQPDTPGQSIPIRVTGGQDVQGLELMIQIADGSFGPLLEGGDILTDTIFQDNHLGVFGESYVEPWRLYLGVVTESGTVEAEGLLATLTLDTTGLDTGRYRLSLTNAIEGPTTFAGMEAELADGWIVIPEPATAALLAAGLAGWALARRRGRSAAGAP